MDRVYGEAPSVRDEELLQEYVARDSEAAFGMLVERYVPLVYNAALRQLDNVSLAEDVTQAVFIIFARKAQALSRKTILSGWLYRTTRHVASKARRTEYRRAQREHEAALMQNTVTDPDWFRLAPVLDDAITQLRESDRTVVLLRFFENKSLKDVGRLLSISEDSAQKRVSRAIVKLRDLLAKDGVTVSTSGLTAAISVHAVPAVPGQRGAIAAAAGLGRETASIPIQNLVRTASRRQLWPLAAGLAGLLILLGFVGLLYFSPHHARRPANAPVPGVAQLEVRVPPPVSPPAPGPAVIRLNFTGTPGLRFNSIYTADSQKQNVSGILPSQISFPANAFTASVMVYGPGQFGFEAYRNERRMAWSDSRFVGGTNTFLIESFAGGRGVRFREIPGITRAQN